MHYSRFAAVSQLLAVGFVAAGPVRRDAPSTVQSAGGYSYLGCASEPSLNGGSGRGLTDNSTDTSDMTIEQCALYCGASNYKYFGVEYYSQCYCGNTLQPGTTIEADNSNCTMPCKGNANEYCGGDWHMNLYGLSSSGSGSTPSSSTTTSVATSAQVAATTPAAATTAVATTTTATAASATYPGTVQCPASDGTTFVTGGQTYQIQCGVDHNGGDATNVNTNSMDDCLVACSKYSGCTDVSWVPGSPGTCYIKTSITPGNSNSAVWGAVLVGGASSSASSTSKLVSSSAISSAISSAVSSTSSTSTAVVKPTVSSSAVASTSSTSSVIPTTSKASSVAPSTFSSATTPKASTTASASTTSKASSTMATSTTSTSAAATANPAFFSLSNCPSISVTRNALLLPPTYKYTPYYTGSGFTQNIINPANSILNPAQQYSIAGSNTACQAAQICLNNINSLSVPYLSIDLHYVSTSSSWQCTAFVGSNILGSYFNVPNSAVTKAYGFSGVLSSTSLLGW